MDPLEPGDQQVGRRLLHGKAFTLQASRCIIQIIACTGTIIIWPRSPRSWRLRALIAICAVEMAVSRVSMLRCPASISWIQIANWSFPHLTIEVGSVYDDLAAKILRI